MAVLATQSGAPRMQLTVGGERYSLPPNVTALHLHAPNGDQCPPQVVAGTAIVGDAQTDPWCVITTYDPTEEWNVRIPPRQASALWSKSTSPGSPSLSVLRLGPDAASPIGPRDYWTDRVAPGDWLLKVGMTTFGISLPPIPALPKIWKDGQATEPRWPWLHALRHHPAAAQPAQAQKPLDARQRAIARWVYTVVLRDLLTRHATLRTDPFETYERGSGYQYLVLYNPAAREPLSFEFLERTLHIGKDYGATHIHDAEASVGHRPRKARDEYPLHQLIRFDFSLADGRCYVAEAGRFWFSHAPQYANVEFLHGISLAELEQLVLQAQAA